MRLDPVVPSLLALAVLVALAPRDACADALTADEVAALRVEIAALQARLAALEARASEPVSTDRVSVSSEGASSPAPPGIEVGPGLDVESADGASSFSVGGRIHYDVYAHDTDQVAATGGSELRRARLHLEGKTAGWGYRLHAEFSGRTPDLRDLYLQRKIAGGTLTIGQFKPYRSLDELVSSNDVSVMERGWNSAVGLFSDRQWQQGIGYQRALPAGSLGVSAFWLREDNTARNEGWGTAVRGTWAPINEDGRLVHLGAWYSLEDGGQGTPGIAIEIPYGGRRGAEALLFESLDGPGFEQRTAGVEFAGTRGGFHWQSEWSTATVSGVAGDGRLDVAYAQLGYLFGGVREYNVGKGLFGYPGAIGNGLWEIVARVDRIRLRDAGGLEAKRLVLGTNWYVNDDLRFMLNWTRGEFVATGDEPSQLALRAQYVF